MTIYINIGSCFEYLMMKFSYKKLFKKLIDLEMKSTELMDEAQISKSTFYKIKNGQNVTTDVLLRICNTLNCDISDVMECVKFETEEIKDEIN